ncbi:MAG: hypothetical protein ACE367_27585 [Acidimicrobiales bacterium]
MPRTGRSIERRPRVSVALLWFVVAVMVLAGCGGGGSSDDEAGPVDPEGTAIEGAEATATPAPTVAPTPTPEPTVAPTPTPEPTVAPTPTPEAEIIAAWERYLRLSIEARGKNPSPEALDFDSYVWGDARQALVQVIADYGASGTYVAGLAVGESPNVVVRDDGAAVVGFCFVTDLEVRSLADDQVQISEGALRIASRVRVDPQGGGQWLVAASEFGPATC